MTVDEMKRRIAEMVFNGHFDEDWTPISAETAALAERVADSVGSGSFRVVPDGDGGFVFEGNFVKIYVWGDATAEITVWSGGHIVVRKPYDPEQVIAEKKEMGLL